MPTAARLVAALACGFATATMVYVLIAYLPDLRLERQERGMLWLFGLFGIAMGWFSLGKQASAAKKGVGIYLGLRAAIATIVWLIFILAVYQVIMRILDNDLKGAEPMVAIRMMFGYGMEFLGYIMIPKLLGIFALTGIIVGVVVRSAAERWD